MKPSRFIIKLVLTVATCLIPSAPHRVDAGSTDLAGVTAGGAVFRNLSSAKAHIGLAAATITIDTPQTVTTLTVPANISLKVVGAGRLDVAAGNRLQINGPFSAPLKPVFGGRGLVAFGPDSIHGVHPEWWDVDGGQGAVFAIQSAIDSITRGDVLLSGRTYELERRTRITLVGSTDAVDAILIPKTGVNVRGEGYGSVLKVADNFTAGGDYVVFGPRKAEPISAITFRNFRIDGNGSRNLVTGTSAGAVRRAMAIWLFAGKDVRIEKVWFENHPGTNVVKFGSDSLSSLVTDSIITGCTFTSSGAAIPGNRRQSDHSTLYVSGRNVRVSDNHLSNPAAFDENGPPAAVLAGIEMHGDDMLVSGNRVENYGTGGYIVGDGIVTARNQQWTGNRFVNMTKLGISIWSVSAVEDVLIDSNMITLNGTLDQGVAGIFQSIYPPDTTVGIDGLRVSNNNISGLDVHSGTVWNGIQLTAVRNAVIQNNVIERIAGAGVLLYGVPGKPLDNRNIKIQGNSIRDTGFNRFGAHPYAIDLVNNGQGHFEQVQISGNRIENSLPLAAEMGGIHVQGPGPVSGVRIEGSNSFVNLKRRDRRIDDSGLKNGVTVDPALRLP
ncbi:MAG: right-handed parallel beta-helix repeat-containing protein [Geobacteraceae bacterium]|nr:right-handed parallel beta-helix repeat-containing protein [Geobacteraceae bacterium]